MNNIYYRKGYEYQLEEDYSLLTNLKALGGNDFVWISPEGVLSIKHGYAWDGPSGPTRHTKNTLRGSLVHDACYQLIKLGVLSIDDRPDADLLLKQILLEDGMNPLRAWWFHKAVQTFGEMYMRNSPDNLLSAP